MNITGSSEDDQQWKSVINSCFVRRLHPSQVVNVLEQCHLERDTIGSKIVEFILVAAGQSPSCCDPLVIPFLTSLINLNIVTIPDIFDGLSSVCPFKLLQQQRNDLRSYQILQDTILGFLSQKYSPEVLTASPSIPSLILKSILRWIRQINAYESNLGNFDDSIPASHGLRLTCYNNLASHLVCFLDNEVIRSNLIKVIPKAVQPKLQWILGNFVSSIKKQLPQSIAVQKLDLLVKMPPISALRPDGNLNLTSTDIAGMISDLVPSITRVGTYIYISAALSGRTTIDDHHLISYLHSRHHGNFSNMVNELIIASFDAYTNVVQRQQHSHIIFCHESFIINKIPHLISRLSTNILYEPLMSDQIVQRPISRLDSQVYSINSSESNGEKIIKDFQKVRHGFIIASVGQGLLSQAGAMALCGVNNVIVGRDVIFTQASLTGELIASANSADKILDELSSMYGDVWVVANAIVDALTELCKSKDTTALRDLTMVMCKKLPLVDIIVQHRHLLEILEPLCNIINEWKYDDDQVEYQPAYEEFSVILLFTIGIINRYDIDHTELKFMPSNSFLIQLLGVRTQPRHVKDLDDKEKQVLSQWIKSLFAVDDKGETIGISDETMSGCSPQVFYLLVPTLYEQMVVATRMKLLAPATLLGGLEFLLQPFLLPSLIDGLCCLVNHEAVNRKSTEVIMPMLQLLLTPPAEDTEPRIMHDLILSIVYSKIGPTLETLAKRLPRKKDISAFQILLVNIGRFQYHVKATEIEIKVHTESNSNMRHGIINLIAQRTVFNAQRIINPIPLNYSHRLVEVAIEVHGAEDILDTIISEIAAQTVAGFGSAALEVAAALICAPSVGQVPFIMLREEGTANNEVKRLDLRTALDMRVTNVPSLLTMSRNEGEALIRLARLVRTRLHLLPKSILGLPRLNVQTIEEAEVLSALDSSVNIDFTLADKAAIASASADLASAITARSSNQDPLSLSLITSDLAMTDAEALNSLGLDDNLFTAEGSITFDLGGAETGNLNAAQIAEVEHMMSAIEPQGHIDPLQTQTQLDHISQGILDDDIFAGIDLGLTGDDDFGF